MGVYGYQPTASAQPPPRSYEDYLREEQDASAAERAALDSEEQSDRPAAAVAPPPTYNNPDVPPEVFIELQKRFKALKSGSPEKNYGIVDAEIGGRKYRYDAYAGQERSGFRRNRGEGPVANFFSRLGTEFTGQRQEELARRQSEAAGRLKEREMGADETYRQAMLASQQRTRSEARGNQRLTIQENARNRAAQRYLSNQPKPRDESQEALSNAQADAARAAAEFSRARSKAIGEGRSASGAPAKPDYTPDQAFTNMRQSQEELRAIEGELTQIDQQTAPSNSHLPDWMQAAMGTGTYAPAKDVQLLGANGKPYKTIPAAQVDEYRHQLLKDRDSYTNLNAKFREIVKNGNHVAGAADTADDFTDDDVPPDQDADEAGGGWDEANPTPAGSGGIEEDQAGKLAAAPPSQSGVPTSGKGRRPKPPPDVLSKLSYRDQLYYQLSDEYPEASDRELKIMALKVIAQQSTSRGGSPARPAPGHGR